VGPRTGTSSVAIKIIPALVGDKNTVVKPFYFSVALPTHSGPRPVIQFRIILHRRYDSLDEGSARRKAATYTHDNINTE
jgi:hypothetical protein